MDIGREGVEAGGFDYGGVKTLWRGGETLLDAERDYHIFGHEVQERGMWKRRSYSVQGVYGEMVGHKSLAKLDKAPLFRLLFNC